MKTSHPIQANPCKLSEVPAASARQPYQGRALSPKAPARKDKSLRIDRKSVPRLGLLFAIIALTGCKTFSFSKYVSPRIVGRVIDEETRQPIPDVAVRRISADEEYKTLDTPKGDLTLEQAPGVRTDKDGRFVLNSERGFAPFRKSGWYSISVAYLHPKYERFGTRYALVNATNTAASEPVVDAGDILLIPLIK